MREQEMLERLLEQYEGFFDITRPFEHEGRPFLAYAHFRQYQEKYILVRRAKMFGFETHEHVFFAGVDRLDLPVWEEYRRFIIEVERDFVKPHKEHMYSYMTLLLLAGSVEEEAAKAVAKTKYTKNYQYSIEGYSTVRVGVVDLGRETLVTNRQGRDLEKVLGRALHA